MDQPTQRHLEAMRKDYRRRLPAKVAQLRAAWHDYAESRFSPGSLAEVERLSHELTGSGASFGLPEVSDLARGILDQCRHAADQSIGHRIEAALDLLGVLAARHAARAGDTPPRVAATAVKERTTSNRSLIYLVDDDPDIAEDLAAQIRASGYEVDVMLDVATFVQAMARRTPAAIVMDMVLREGKLAGAQAIADHVANRAIPTVFISVREDFEARLAAVRAGAKGYLTKPVNGSRLVDLLDRATHRHAGRPYRVLIVEDDEPLARLFTRLLEQAAVDVLVLHTAIDALDAMEEFEPELLLLDVMLPGVSGLEFGALIRQCDKFNHVPIVFLTADATVSTRSMAMQLGGDDFLVKPVDNEFLVESLLARLARARMMRQGSMEQQEALAQFELMRTALDKHAIVSIADADGRITYVNGQFSETSGYTVEELLGQNHRIVKSGLHDQAFYAEMWQKLTSGQVWHGAISNRAKSGHIYDTISTIVPLLDASGRPQRYFAIRTDVTALNQLRRELDSQATHLSLALAATDTGTWEWRRDSGDIDYSDSWRTLLGYTGDQAGAHWHEMTHPDDFPANVEAMKAHIEGVTPVYSVECRVKNARGEWDWVSEVGKVVERDAHGRPARIVGTTQLINKRHAMEVQREALQAELVQAQKMEAMGHLAAGVAHDFNNMLGAMLGYAELSQEMLSRPDSTGKIDAFLKEILIAGTRAKELISQMLVFSRTGRDQSGPAPITLVQPVIKEVVHLLRSSIPATIDINYRIEDDSLRVRIPPVHLHQIVLNLGINARDAIGEYGRVDVGIARREANAVCASCRSNVAGTFVELTVTDSGQGISEHLVSKIFDPFFTTKDVGKGTGMGLSVVHGIVHGIGGHITVQSRHGEGTSLRILLPLAEVGSDHTPLAPAGDRAVLPDALAGLRIMVVDDEKTMGAMLQELLGLYGAVVTTFDRPVAALAEFMRRPEVVDLVVTDEAMPDLSGMDMARTMLQQRPGLPVILCTGYSEHATADSTKAAGIRGFMDKPIDVEKLIDLATHLTRGKEDTQ